MQDQLLKKQAIVREKLGEEKFKIFLNNKLDFTMVYKAAYKYYQDPDLQNIQPV